MSAPLVFAIPSKGRLKDQVEAWLEDAGFQLASDGGERGYRARLNGLRGVEVRLLSAGEIAQALDTGEAHLGVTGEDLLRERGDGLDDRVMLLKALGFGRADLVVAAPQSWIDVDVMADVDEVAHAYLSRTGARLRVATKYGVQTRAFFARHGVADYRIVDSAGATEGAPAAGTAELVVDITTTGATLKANDLKIIADGVILRSEAHLAASLRARWSTGDLEAARRLVSAAEARTRARTLAALRWPSACDGAARAALSPLLDRHRLVVDGEGVLAPMTALLDLTTALTAAGVGPVVVTRPAYVFEASCPAVEALGARVSA